MSITADAAHDLGHREHATGLEVDEATTTNLAREERKRTCRRPRVKAKAIESRGQGHRETARSSRPLPTTTTPHRSSVGSAMGPIDAWLAQGERGDGRRGLGGGGAPVCVPLVRWADARHAHARYFAVGIRSEVRHAAPAFTPRLRRIAVPAPRGLPGVAHDPVVAARRVRAVADDRAVVRFAGSEEQPPSHFRGVIIHRPAYVLPLARRVQSDRHGTNGGQRV